VRARARGAPEGEPSPAAVRAGGHDAERARHSGRVPGAGIGVATPVVVPRWVQAVVLPLGLIALWLLARAAGTIFLVLIVASIIALILAPVVRLLERVIPRGLAILLVYLAGFAVLVAIGILLATLIANQVSSFVTNVPSLTRSANRELVTVQNWFNQHGIHVHITQQGQSALESLQKQVVKRSSTILSFSRGLLSGIVQVGFDLVLILVLSIYLLVYGPQIGRLVRSIMPPGDGTPADDYPLLVQHAVSGYVRGQLLFSLAMGASAAISLEIFGLVGLFPAGRSYGVFFGAFYGLMEFIPYIGPIIGPVPAVAVGLFGNPITAVWLVLLFIGLQQLEGHIVAPQVFRISLRINPIIIILALLLGYQIYGIVGALVALPVIAVLRQTVLYLRRHLVLEPWGTRGVGIQTFGAPGGGSRTSPPDPPGVHPDTGTPSASCSDCGAPVGGGDAHCRACGAELRPAVPGHQ
jgi:predicted PurR-regulated permease PerM